MKKINTLWLVFLLGNLISTTYAATYNKALSSANQPWHFEVAPYSWMSSVSADMTIKNTTNHIYVPFSEVLNDLDFAGEVHLEAAHGPWTLMLDPTYIKLSTNVVKSPIYVGPIHRDVVGPVTSHIVAQTTLIDGGVFYQAYQGNAFSLELLGGGRYFDLKNSMALDASILDHFAGIRLVDTINVIAPIVGGRIKHDYSKGYVWLRGDVGGFGIDHVTNTWSATAGVAYSVSPHFEVGAAYRVLQIDINKSADSKINSLLYGPEVGIAFHN